MTGAPKTLAERASHCRREQSQEQDLNAAIDNIIHHQNVAPFISKQLIQHLVTSNPSPGYVERIAGVFAANRDSPTQLQEVVRAILLDPEARGDFKDPAAEPNYGKLREPVLFITNILRAFNATSDGVLDSLHVEGSAIGSGCYEPGGIQCAIGV